MVVFMKLGRNYVGKLLVMFVMLGFVGVFNGVLGLG